MVKLLDKMRNNPRDDWTIQNIQTLCGQEGLDCLPPSGGGSHWQVRHPLVNDVLTVPAHRPIKPIYVKRLVQLVAAVRAAKEAEEKKRKAKQ